MGGQAYNFVSCCQLLYSNGKFNQKINHAAKPAYNPDNTTTLAQRCANAYTSIGTTLAPDVGNASFCPLGKRCNNIGKICVGPTLCQQCANVTKSVFRQRWANVGPTDIIYIAPTLCHHINQHWHNVGARRWRCVILSIGLTLQLRHKISV